MKKKAILASKKIYLCILIILMCFSQSGCLFNTATEENTTVDAQENHYTLLQDSEDIALSAGGTPEESGNDGDDENSLVVSFSKSINERLPELTFNILFGQDCFSNVYSHLENPAPSPIYWMESITIIGADGEHIQEIRDFDKILVNGYPGTNFEDSREMPYYEYLHGLGFGDFNSDGYLDLFFQRDTTPENPLRLVSGSFYYFIWDIQMNQFILNQQLIDLEEHGFWQAITDFWSRAYDEDFDMMGNSGMWIDEQTQMLVFTTALSGEWSYFPPFERAMDSWTIYQYYQYIDGRFELITMQEMLFDWEGNWQVRELDVATEVETVTFVESTQPGL